MGFGGAVADDNDTAEAAERLERALERIAARASLVSATPPAGPDEDGDETEAEVARRLDTLIDRIRSALGPQTGG